MQRKQYGWQLPKEIERRLGETSYGRQRAMFEAGHLFLILHTPPLDGESDRDAILFLRTPDGKYFCNGHEGGETHLRRLLATYDDIYEKYDDLYDNCATAKGLFQLIAVLLPLNRATSNLHSALQTARSSIEGDSFLIAMRDEAYEISRNFELLIGDAKLALDYRIAANTEAQAIQTTEMATAQHKLNILAAVTFPLMAVATLMGMNLVHGFEQWPPLLFWSVVAFSAFIGWSVKGWVTRGNGNAPYMRN